MELSQVVGMRTRSRTLALASAAAAAAEKERAGSKRRKGAEPAEVQNSYLQLRSRSLVMTPRTARTPANSGSARPGCRSPASSRLSSCSSKASSEVVSVEGRLRFLRSGDPEGDDDLKTSLSYFQCSRERRETTPSSELRGESCDLGSTAGKRKSRRSAASAKAAAKAAAMAAAKALAVEIDEFFSTAERAASENLQFFGDKYNFDVSKEAPLDGRYEWHPVKP